MVVERRISASFKDIPGGQILGASYDYTHRLLDFDLLEESIETIREWLNQYKKDVMDINPDFDLDQLPKVVDYLREEGLLHDVEENNTEPIDITKQSMQFPATRSERFQVLTRGKREQ